MHKLPNWKKNQTKYKINDVKRSTLDSYQSLNIDNE